ncbi:hypothetical protein N7475_008679 [Penicillium sp. IBT 31633x]|nr:hypothetical protein N7475_008679 [Penicillium sp. IBT 31633x]
MATQGKTMGFQTHRLHSMIRMSRQTIGTSSKAATTTIPRKAWGRRMGKGHGIAMGWKQMAWGRHGGLP